MRLQLIRNATMRLTYNGHVILTDPFLAPKNTIESFAGISENPLVDLPMPPQHVIEGAEMVLLSHRHVDHFDLMAQKMLDKSLPVYCQPGDEEHVAANDFGNIMAVEDVVEWEGIGITRTPGQHGTGEMAERMGKVSGFVFQAEGEPTVYWCGDTIWYPPVEETIEKFKPDVIITHSSGATFKGHDPILMDTEQTLALVQAAPGSKVVAIHMDSLDHGTVSRPDLRTAAGNAGLSKERFFVPEDGEELSF
jgi:L-ascorbate metabolism protein UlaG (beta-lactamase superfamily)